MTVIGFWVAADAPRSMTTLTYILAHESREAADSSWEAFIDDPRRDDYEHELIVENVERMFLHATDFSAIKMTASTAARHCVEQESPAGCTDVSRFSRFATVKRRCE